MKLDIDAYLNRIHYHGPRTPTAETLRDLQVAHLMSVPFENLSIHNEEPIVLDDNSLFTKVVTKKRGGFCYELNGLFAALLRDLGFDVTMLEAGVAHGEGGFGPSFDHMLLLVKLNERWVVDVGFGDSFLEPLLLDDLSDQIQDGGVYRIVRDEENFVVQRKDSSGNYVPQYRFNTDPHTYADYEEMCLFHQTSPHSHFTVAPLCSIATASGRVTLSGMRLITTIGAGVEQTRNEQSLASEVDCDRVLHEKFGITIDRT